MILGGWPVDPRLGGLTCRQQIDKLEKLARPLQPGRGHRPPLLRVRGGVRHHGVRWFIDELTWGDVIVGNRRIMRAQATVTLKRFAGIEFARVPEDRSSRSATRSARARDRAESCATSSASPTPERSRRS